MFLLACGLGSLPCLPPPTQTFGGKPNILRKNISVSFWHRAIVLGFSLESGQTKRTEYDLHAIALHV